jgi:hypothetical protein
MIPEEWAKRLKLPSWFILGGLSAFFGFQAYDWVSSRFETVIHAQEREDRMHDDLQDIKKNIHKLDEKMDRLLEREE